MNLKHVNSNIWTKLALTAYCTSIGLGLYGQSRTKFSNDFTYNVTLPLHSSLSTMPIEIPLWCISELALWHRSIPLSKITDSLALRAMLPYGHRF